MPAIADFSPQSNRTAEISTPSGNMWLTSRPITSDERLSDSSETFVIMTSDAGDRAPLIKNRLLNRLNVIIDWRDVRGPDGRSIEFSRDRLLQLMTLSQAWLECIAAAVNSFWNEEPSQAPATEQAA